MTLIFQWNAEHYPYGVKRKKENNMKKVLKALAVFGVGFYFGKVYNEVQVEKKYKKPEAKDIQEKVEEDLTDTVEDIKTKLKKAVEEITK